MRDIQNQIITFDRFGSDPPKILNNSNCISLQKMVNWGFQ